MLGFLEFIVNVDLALVAIVLVLFILAKISISMRKDK